MKLLFSPAKTFRKTNHAYQTKPMFLNQTQSLVEKLKLLSVQDIQKHMHISEKVASITYDYYQSFGDHLYPAIYLYHGQAYRALDVDSFDAKSYKRLCERVYIFSGLYGLLRPTDGISQYRLEMKDKTITDLYAYWRDAIEDVLKQESLVVSLSSKEFEQVLTPLIPLVTIGFSNKTKKGLTSAPSMAIKTLRGKMLRHVLTHDVQSLDQMRKIVIDGYRFDPKSSHDRHLNFIKKT